VIAIGALSSAVAEGVLLERIHTSEWVEWLDTLFITGPVHVEPEVALPRRSHGCRFRAADYTALEDHVELVFEDEHGLLRVVIEAPTAIFVQHEGTFEEQVVFETAQGEFVLRRCRRSAVAS
jgi:hypothetical protein